MNRLTQTCCLLGMTGVLSVCIVSGDDAKPEATPNTSPPAETSAETLATKAEVPRV